MSAFATVNSVRRCAITGQGLSHLPDPPDPGHRRARRSDERHTDRSRCETPARDAACSQPWPLGASSRASSGTSPGAIIGGFTAWLSWVWLGWDLRFAEGFADSKAPDSPPAARQSGFRWVWLGLLLAIFEPVLLILKELAALLGPQLI